MERVEIVKTKENHIDYILADISPICRNDIENNINRYNVDFRELASQKDKCVTIILYGKPVAIIGIPKAGNVNDFVWVVFTNEVMKHRKELHRTTLKIVRLWLTKFDAVRTLCDVENKISKRWLASLGFEVIGLAPEGEFLMEAK